VPYHFGIDKAKYLQIITKVLSCGNEGKEQGLDLLHGFRPSWLETGRELEVADRPYAQ
jgi:hypothetical protein